MTEETKSLHPSDVLEETSLQLVEMSERQGMTMWSEEKRNEFAKTFEDRAGASRYIMIRTAEIMWSKALHLRFLSDYHVKEEKLHFDYKVFHVNRFEKSTWGERIYSTMPIAIGGRMVTDLNVIAEDRATQILKQLPPLKTAVRIMSKETADWIDRRDVLLGKIRALKTQLEGLQSHYSLAEVDQSMTIGQFRTAVKDRERQRKALVAQMDEFGQEGTELDQKINRALYLGLPGLSAAVIKVVRDHLERATALDQTSRRVSEKVRFGDSDAALDLLKGFEKDELVVSDNIKAEFARALDFFKISKGARQLTAKEKKAVAAVAKKKKKKKNR